MTGFIILTMIALHIFSDYSLQVSCKLDDLKQIWFWEEHPIGKDKKYQYDYLIALLLHSISWAYITFLPFLLFKVISINKIWQFSIIIITNTLIHAIIDDIKAKFSAGSAITFCTDYLTLLINL